MVWCPGDDCIADVYTKAVDTAKFKRFSSLLLGDGPTTIEKALVKSVADELAPRYADLYLLESVEAAVGIATDRLREEFGAAVFKAQARVVLDRIRYCYRGNRDADARRHLQQARWRSRAAHARCHGRPRGRYSSSTGTGARSRGDFPRGKSPRPGQHPRAALEWRARVRRR